MKRWWMICLIVTVWVSVNLVVYFSFPASEPEEFVEERGFVSKVYTDSLGIERKYVVFVPRLSMDGERPPLILFLHGAGERGNNGIDPMMTGLGPVLYHQYRDLPFVVVFPQCQRDGDWRVDGPDARYALDVLRLTAHEYRTDPDRVYLTGYSMGGSGTWSIAGRYPEMFAATCSTLWLRRVQIRGTPSMRVSGTIVGTRRTGRGPFMTGCLTKRGIAKLRPDEFVARFACGIHRDAGSRIPRT